MNRLKKRSHNYGSTAKNNLFRMLFGFLFCFLSGVSVYGGTENLLKLDITRGKTGDNRMAIPHYGMLNAWEIISISDDVPPGVPGGRSLRFDFSNKPRSGNWGLQHDTFPLDPAKHYRMSILLKTNGRMKGYGAMFAYEFLDKNKKNISGSSYPYVKTLGAAFFHQAPMAWRYYSHELYPDATPGDGKYKQNEIPSNAAYVRCSFGCPNYAGIAFFAAPAFEEFRLGTGPLRPGDEKVLPIERSSAIIQPDGVLNEEIWQKSANWRDDFFKAGCDLEATSPISGKTRFKVAADGKSICIAVICRQDMKKLTCEAKTADKFSWQDDYVDIFLNPTGNRDKPFFQITVNPATVVSQLWQGRKTDLFCRGKSFQTNDSWGFELTIPISRLNQLLYEAGLKLEPAVWTFNIGRVFMRGNASERLSAWSYTRGFGASANFGYMLFAAPNKVLDTLWQKSQKEIELLAEQNKNILPDSAGDSPQIKTLKAEIRKAIADFQSDGAKISRQKTLSAADFSRLERRRLDMLPAIKAKLNTLKRNQFVIPENCKAKGYAVWRLPVLSKASVSLCPEPGQITDTLNLRGAAGGSITTQFALFPFQPLKNLEFKVSGLHSGDGKSFIPASDIKLRIVRRQNPDNDNVHVLTTDSRIPLTGLLQGYHKKPIFISSAPAFESIMLHLSIRTGTIQPGEYRGKITITGDGKKQDSIMIRENVLPVVLDAPQKLYGFYYLGILQKPDPRSVRAWQYRGSLSPERMKNELRKLYQDGFHLATLYCYIVDPLNPAYCQEVMDIAAQAGFRDAIIMGTEHLVPYDDGRTAAEKEYFRIGKKKFAERVPQILQDAAKLGYKNIYFYTVDEATGERPLRKLKMLSQLIHANGGRTACAGDEKARNAAGKFTDMPIMGFSGISGEDFHAEFNKKINNGGKSEHQRVLYYQFYSNQPNMTRLTFGAYLYRSGYDGCVPWAWYEASPDGKSPNYKTVWYVIQTADEPIHTLAYEAALEGMTDMRYIRTLERTIRDCPDKERAARGRRELTSLLSRIELFNDNGKNELITPAWHESMREKLIDLILDIKK